MTVACADEDARMPRFHHRPTSFRSGRGRMRAAERSHPKAESDLLTLIQGLSFMMKMGFLFVD
jgi:hypothetical protein